VCLVPPEADVHKVITKILSEVKFDSDPFDLLVGKSSKLAKVQIARIIADTPGVAEICHVKSHRAGFALLCFTKY
jgi:uncharacterized protein (DUF362 family)